MTLNENKRASGQIYVALDFDGTMVRHEFPKVGKDIGAETVLKELINSFDVQYILFTMRDAKYLEDAVQWFKDKNIPLFGINTNPTQKSWTKSPKAFADIYIDDLGIGIPTKKDQDYKVPYVDWQKLKPILVEKLTELTYDV